MPDPLIVSGAHQLQEARRFALGGYRRVVRHLTRDFAAGALRRGKEIEQFLEAFEEDGRRGLKHAAIWDNRSGCFVVRLWIVEENPGPTFLPIDEFLAFYDVDDEQEGGRHVGTADSPGGAIELAAQKLGAHPERWVNQGVLFDEYYDYVKQGRPLGRWSHE
ncbi:hypothetical protein GCM10023194_78760 [Planotetraspora phitsanulokensis]|uniref:Uncharacterized protein n=1 Tax=Planotetraspora phitsanulokensis TaxID=575192 RepID=A0A8J3UAE9_9ACTN|nr:hypothetical protein [Planotetraspora phitsanulokensis]GII41162.1 hypothetical protein Pph01_61650 [Planotetraspora phitsanulokensis]